MRKSLLALSLLAATSAPVLAADYSDGDIHKNDYKWMQFNLMGAFNELPGFPDGSNHDYLEMEFGGRSGIFDLYGYVDVFNLASDPGSDKSGKEKIFMKFAPRMSLDAVTGKDLSFGPVQELYVSTLMEWGGASEVNSQVLIEPISFLKNGANWRHFYLLSSLPSLSLQQTFLLRAFGEYSHFRSGGHWLTVGNKISIGRTPSIGVGQNV